MHTMAGWVEKHTSWVYMLHATSCYMLQIGYFITVGGNTLKKRISETLLFEPLRLRAA